MQFPANPSFKVMVGGLALFAVVFSSNCEAYPFHYNNDWSTSACQTNGVWRWNHRMKLIWVIAAHWTTAVSVIFTVYLVFPSLNRFGVYEQNIVTVQERGCNQNHLIFLVGIWPGLLLFCTFTDNARVSGTSCDRHLSYPHLFQVDASGISIMTNKMAIFGNPSKNWTIWLVISSFLFGIITYELKFCQLEFFLFLVVYQSFSMPKYCVFVCPVFNHLRMW